MDLANVLSTVEGIIIVWLMILTLLNIALDVDELWLTNAILFAVECALMVALGQSLWMAGIFLLAALVCVIRVGIR